MTINSTRTTGAPSLPTILHVTTVHKPFDTRIFQKESRALARAGFDVRLATTLDDPAEVDGVSLLPLGSNHRSRIHRLGRAFRAFLTISAHRGAIVQIHDPELLPVALLPAMFGTRVVYDVHEFHRENIRSRGWIPEILRPIASGTYALIEDFALRWFAGVVVVVEPMRERYRKRLPSDRLALVRNYPNISAEDIQVARRLPHPLDGRPYVVHTGGAARRVNYHLLVQCAEVLRKQAPDLSVVNIGTIDLTEYAPAERLALRARAAAAGVVEFERLSYTEVLQWLAHARIGYIPLEDSDNHREALPNKLFEYLHFGLPVVADRVGRTAEIITARDVGTVVEATGTAHAAAIRAIHSDESTHQRFRAHAQQSATDFSFANEFPALQALYERICVSTS